MSNQIPVILDSDGELKRLPTGDTLVNRAGTPYYPGLSGAGGGITTSYTFSTTTTDSDPGSGTLRLNNSTQASATEIYLDDLDSNGNDWSILAGIPPIANPIGSKTAYVRLSAAGDSSKFIVWLLTATTDESGYYTLYGTMYNKSSNSPFTNGQLLLVTFTQNGDPGADGSDAAITPGTTDNAIVRADGTSNSAIQGSTAVISDAGALTLTAASSLYGSGSKLPVLSVKDASSNVVFEVTAHTTGNNIGLGPNTTNSITTGTLNIGIGNNACTEVSTGNSNVGLGGGAASAIQSGSSNMCIGTNAGLLITSGNSNMCIGVLAGSAITTTNNNVCIGTSAGLAVTGGGNVCIGTSAGQSINAASLSVFIGLNNGNNASQLATATSCVCIGYNSYTSGNNAVVIGQSCTAAANGIAIGNSVTATANQAVLGPSSITDTRLQGQVSVARSLTVNDAGGDYDMRVEGDTLPYMLFLDASAATENIALLAGSAPNWQSMDRGLFIANSSTAPTGNPSGGGFLFVDSGALKWRGSSGTVTTIAPA